MKKWMIVAGIACTAACVNAAPGDSTKEQYLAGIKKQAEGKSWDFNPAKAEETFNAIDTNQDGIASGTEKKAYWADKEGAAKKAPKPAAAPAKEASKPAADSAQKLAKGSSTLEMFITEQKAQAEKKGWKFVQANVEKTFATMDANHDGVATGLEKKAYWAEKIKK
jgi:hypothetical protein